MKVWQVHSGPYDELDNWWLVCKVEVDEEMEDVEIMFSSLDHALTFKEKVNSSFEPIVVRGETDD